MRRVVASLLLGLAISMAWVPAATAEESLPSEPASEAPSPDDQPTADDLPTLELPTVSPSATPTEPPTATPSESPTEPATEPSTEPPTEPPTSPATDPPTEQPTDLPSEAPTEPPTVPTEPPYVNPRTQLPATAYPMTARQVAVLAAAVISPISALTSSLFGAPLMPVATSAPTAGVPSLPLAPEVPSPSTSPDTADVALSGSDTDAPSGGLPWGGLAVILLCAAAGVIGYSFAARGGSGTLGRP
jgi:hypothetical protein